MGILARLSLQNFRNYECLDFELSPGVTVLVGDNGQGKSNFLEAVYFLAVLRSFRCQQLSNLYRWGTSCFVVRGVLQCEDGREVSLAVQYDRKRQLRVAGQPVARASEFIGNLFTVAFVPEDIELIKGAAGTRRRFLDVTLCQMYPRYLTLLQEYAKAHKSRNMLLRHDAIDRQALSAFDRVMAERGASIIDYRHRFFEELSRHQDPIAGAYCGGWPLRLNYRPSIGNDPSATVEELTEQLMEALLESLPRDRQRGQSHVGPHRDDYLFMLEDKSLHLFGSEGQCRTAALICKLGTAHLLCAMKKRESVVLLVDDVIGELDSQHREAFFSLLGQGAQTLFACTDPGLAANFESPACYRVSGGRLV